MRNDRNDGTLHALLILMGVAVISLAVRTFVGLATLNLGMMLTNFVSIMLALSSMLVLWLKIRNGVSRDDHSDDRAERR